MILARFTHFHTYFTMEALSQKYQDKLSEISKAIQESEELKVYLEEEEEEQYNALKDAHEPQIQILYQEVSENDPLQILDFELKMLDPDFEGLFMPKILGYSVLRGEVNEECKYARPQKHFKNVISAICSSSNFEYIKNRMGQGTQLGIALCTDIWVTNLIQSFETRTVKQYLSAQKIQRFRDFGNRRTLYNRYKKQFAKEHYFTCQIPSNKNELKIESATLLTFLKARYDKNLDSSSFLDKIIASIDDKSYYGIPEQYKILIFILAFYKPNDSQHSTLSRILNENRREVEDFDELMLQYILVLVSEGFYFNKDVHLQISSLIDNSIEDKLTSYFSVMKAIHEKGYTDQGVMDMVDIEYRSNSGLSTENECLRIMLLSYIKNFYSNISDEEYLEFFEMSKIYAPYMTSFNNQKFNQSLKNISLTYVKRLIKKYTDKRSKEYQEVKRFVAATMQSLGLMTEKEIVELFKSRRKKKVVA